MSSDENEPILHFTIKVDAETTANTESAIDELEAKKEQEREQQQREEALDFEEEERQQDPDFFDARKNAIHQSTEEAIQDAIDTKVPDEIMSALEDIDPKLLQKIFNKAKNPEAGLMELLDAVLPAKAQMIMKIALAGGGGILVAQEIIKILAMKGGPLNRDWRRFLDQEVDAGLSRELQKRRELGFDQVILPQQVGFIPNNENWTFNSLYGISESRIARIGLDDRAAGVLTRG